MTRLTDDEIGTLLRETFAAKESLTDTLPQATKRPRPFAPALLAAAAVLAVLAGVLYVANRVGQPDQSPPVASAATPAASESGDIWGAAIVTIARRFEPADVKWTAVRVQGHVISWPPKGTTPTPGHSFSAAEKARIEQAVRPLAPVVWSGTASPESCVPGRVPTVEVGPIIDKGDHQEVRVTFIRSCADVQRVTPRLEKVDGVWKVTG